MRAKTITEIINENVSDIENLRNMKLKTGRYKGLSIGDIADRAPEVLETILRDMVADGTGGHLFIDAIRQVLAYNKKNNVPLKKDNFKDYLDNPKNIRIHKGDYKGYNMRELERDRPTTVLNMAVGGELKASGNTTVVDSAKQHLGIIEPNKHKEDPKISYKDAKIWAKTNKIVKDFQIVIEDISYKTTSRGDVELIANAVTTDGYPVVALMYASDISQELADELVDTASSDKQPLPEENYFVMLHISSAIIDGVHNIDGTPRAKINLNKNKIISIT
ncbi:MAG: hypothetical protein ACRDD8_11250 [Bacteroidales bacterium]